MTIDEYRSAVQELLDRIENGYGDNEDMHMEEDRLMVKALRAIASGEEADPREWARLALTLADSLYTRWYA